MESPTCKVCGGTFPESALKPVAGLPACEACAERLRNFPFPAWVKLAFLFLLALAIASFAMNWRFLAGHRTALAAQRAAAVGNVERAATLMASASSRVPESGPLAFLASYYRAVELVQEDKASEALPFLNELKRRVPLSPGLDSLLLQAESAVAFEAKDYDRFLEKSLALLKLEPRAHPVLGMVASAYACKYAVTGNEEFKKEALRYLDLARQAAGPNDPRFKEYEERILYRIETREILSKKEYDQRFRQGDRKKGNGIAK